jgi:type II secretory pathway component PulF
MKNKAFSKIWIVIILIILIGVIYFLQDYQKTERQYQACLDKCDIEVPLISGFNQKEFVAQYTGEKIETNESCRISCKEKYSK